MNNTSIESTDCDCCGKETYHIPLELEDITYIPGEGFVMHLTLDEVMQLRAQLATYL